MDALDEVLRLIHLKSSVYFKSDFPEGWGMEVPEGPFAQFHMVVRGQCQLGHQGRVIKLYSGDIVIFPHGDHHWISDHDKAEKRNGRSVVSQIQCGEDPFSGQHHAVTLICGHFEYDRTHPHEFISSLPSLIHIEDHVLREFSWLEKISDVIMMEADLSQLGSTVLTNKLAEVLYIQVIRTYVLKNLHGFNEALVDPQIGYSLKLIHTEPEVPWTIAELAKQSGTSRTLFANRFKKLVGQTPLSYLTEWRMLQARDLLKFGEIPLSMVPEKVGYGSESSFNRAFRRRFGMTPGRFKRTAWEETISDQSST